MGTGRYLSPPAVAERLGISPEKVISWIVSGELRAANVASRGSSRPRWRIAPESLDDFLAARSASPSPPNKRRASATGAGREWF